MQMLLGDLDRDLDRSSPIARHVLAVSLFIKIGKHAVAAIRRARDLRTKPDVVAMATDR